MSVERSPVKSIVVVGGGSAGWITASLLNSYLNVAGRPPISISLVESPDIPTIGVGEATIPNIRQTLAKIGVGERDFMRATDATFKSLIRFHDWNAGQEFDHPFDRRSRPATNDAVTSWLAAGRDGRDFAKQFSLLSNVCDRNLAPKATSWPDYQSPFPYAYHLDAVKFAEFLAEDSVRKGVQRILATVSEITLNESGDISALTTDDGQTLQADLYIDCTGFRSQLISAIEPGVRDFSSTLLCDRAVTLQVPYETYRPDHIRPYTNATALSAGWRWDINLQGRRGTGYVYSSQFLSEDEAEQELRTREGRHADGLTARHIEFRTYKRDKSWANNCIAIGLSDCFVEPLESSGLFMIEFAAHLLGETLAAQGGYGQSSASHFNRVMDNLGKEVVDYVSLHYLTSTRRDTDFWREATLMTRASPQMRDLLDQWKTRQILDTDILSLHRVFSFESYEFLLHGMEYCRPAPSALGAQVRADNSAELEKCYRTLPTHEMWLGQL